MAVIAPNSEIYLIKCPIELDNLNQLSFANAEAQHNYFNGLPKLSLTNATFQRKDGTIRWPGSMEDILEYNYCMYRNKNHGNKWFYAFVDSMEYVSDGMTAVSISTDCFQTWQFDIEWKQSFIEREHVNNDTFGLHTIDEGLNAGEYVVSAVAPYSYTSGNLCIAAMTSDLPDEIYNYQVSGTPIGKRARMYNGLPNGCYISVFSGKTLGGNDYQALYNAFMGFIQWMDGIGKGDAIVSMFVIPESFLPANYNIISIGSADNNYSTDIVNLPPSYSAYLAGTITINRSTTIDGYVPKNNKCFCYPFNYLMVSNNGGAEVVYHWEYFYDNNGTVNPEFKCYGVINQGCDMKFIPTNYANTGESGGYLWSVSSQKLPTISWNSDYYLNWQAKNGWNSVSRSIDRVADRSRAVNEAEKPKDILQKTGDFISGVAGWIGNTFNAITKTISGQDYQASIVPDSAQGNANSGDINYVLGKANFTSYKMCCKREKIETIDKYFSMYGYKVNTVKIPNITGRSNWNYVKTVGCNITGDIPQGDIQTLKNIFDNGTTIWHNPSTFLDYSQNNNIV